MVCLSSAFGQKLQLEIEPEWQGKPLVLGQRLPNERVDGISVSRLDGLLSQLALQRTDGSWLESEQWHVYLNAQKQRLSATADGLPAQEFKAIRFRVGVDAKTDASDPQVWPPEHPLHPDVCGLHWGWSSGYVFLAIEGHWTPVPARPADAKPSSELRSGDSSLRTDSPTIWPARRSRCWWSCRSSSQALNPRPSA